MSIYSLNGDVLSSCYNKGGTSLAVAYDKGANQVFSDSPTPSELKLKMMTYNVQSFNGINSQPAMQTEIINGYKPDLIGMQELGNYTASTLPAVGQTMLADYSVKQFSNHKNKLMLVAKDTQLSNVVATDFQNQDPEDLSQYNETRAYLKANITVGGKTITLINTHLCYLTESIKWLQMGELFAIAEQCEYVIITGDFNSMQMSETADDYVHMYKQFVDAGYNLANNSPSAGFQNTFTVSSTATSLGDLTSAPDSIIVSGNIDITNVVFVTTKFRYLNGSKIDHIPVVVTLRLN